LDPIFDKDPLLLRDENQQDYGNKILYNLVIGRSLAICFPEYADLHSHDTSVVVEPSPSPPPEELRHNYLQSRIQRKRLPDDEQKLLEAVTMVARGDETGGRRPDAEGHCRFASYRTAMDDLKAAKSKLGKRLRIAAVGFRVKISKLVDKGFLEEDLCVLGDLAAIDGLPDSRELEQLGRTKPLPKEGEDRWAKTVCQHIKTAVDRGSHIVVLPELALPPAREGFDIEQTISECSKSAGSSEGNPDHFIFAGSRHEGGYNRGLVLHLKEHELATKWHYKMTSARSLRENVLGPRDEKQWSYPIRVALDDEIININVMLAICYDAFDPTMFLNLVLHNAKQIQDKQERLIIVASFNPSSQFVEMLRDLSFLSACPVLYVNSLHGDAKMFICGVAVRDVLAEGSLINLLDREIRDLKAELQKRKEGLRKKATSDPGFRYMEDERLRTGQLENRVDRLTNLYDSLVALQSKGGLNHMITIEDCAACDENRHVDDYECANDILYYNIDYDLIRALWRFRNTFFADDRFLPAPLRSEALRDAAREMEKRRVKRVARGL